LADLVDDLGLSQNALLCEGQPIGQLATSGVGKRGADFDPVQLPGREGEVAGNPDSLGDRAAALASLVDPVADGGRAVDPIDPMEADDAGEGRSVEDGELDPFFVG
jgi:hypothetical protein